MKLSIAMATYNGSKHVEEQVRSFADQARPPDELVVCDDLSTDGTLEIVEGLRGRVGFPIRAYRNEARLGFIGNFSRAIGLCTGDILFPSDQDDVWLADKLRRHEEAYRADPAVGLAFNDSWLVDDALHPLGKTSFQQYGHHDRRLDQLDGDRAILLLTRMARIDGCTLSFRAGLWPKVLPIPEPFGHDEWLAAVACMVGRIKAIREPLNLYRQHASQSIGINDLKAPSGRFLPSRQQWLEHLAIRNTLILQRMMKLEKAGVAPPCQDYHAYMRGHLAHLWRRVSYPKSLAGRLPMCLGELLSGRYGKYNESVKDTLSLDLRPRYFRDDPR